jgi:hypothetical protein
VAVGVGRRGTEAHEPADGMRINRDRVLAIERVGLGSAVAQAIQADRELAHASAGRVSLNPTTVAGTNALTAQRVAAEHDIARSWNAAVDQLRKINDLVLPVTKSEAQAITDKAVADLRTVRRNALAKIANKLGMSSAEADAYVRSTDPLLEGPSFANEPAVLLAPDLDAIVTIAAQLYTQVGDAAAKLLTEPKPTPAPSPSARP